MIETSAADLRRATLAEVRGVSLRSGTRDLWVDESALFDRLSASWCGLDDAAWHVPGAAPSDAGGPDWSLAEHVGHVVHWQELAASFTAQAIETGRWPDDSDFDGGDFDTYNERYREPWTSMPRDEILDRFATARRDLLAVVRGLTDAEVRSDAAWGWVFMTLHGHYLDHAGIIETWTDTLRIRQIDGDPFVDDPRPVDHASFLAADDASQVDFDRIIRTIPADRWDTEPITPGWTLRDHVGHLSDWAEEGLRALDVYARRGHWPADPDEGVDAWNDRMVTIHRGTSVADTLVRYDASRAALRAAVLTLSLDDLRSPDGWSWMYDCLYGHVRKHLAMVGPWCAAQTWPAARI